MMSARDITELEDRLYNSAFSSTPSLGSDSSDRGETTFFTITPSIQTQTIQPSTVSLVPYYDQDDPIDHIDDIFTELRNREVEEKGSCTLPADITERMYSILIDWLVDVCIKFKETVEVYMNCCYLIKYCLDNKDFSDLKKSKLQLLGCTCLLISTKNAIRHDIEIKDLVLITDKAFTKAEFISMEKRILSVTQFHTRFAIPRDFISIYGQILGLVTRSFIMTRYLSESCMCYFKLLCDYLPSELALGCLYLAITIIKQSVSTWDIVSQISGVNHKKIVKIAQAIYDSVTGEQHLRANIRKFADIQFNRVSKIPLTRPT